ncbi:MAG: hypothetical protein JKY32_07760 [Rhizobiales bacterium]|nr:hypothetical protein [Hyphomicrobiales bacterium]
MGISKFAIYAGVVFSTVACASISEGTTQNITFYTTPQGASCTILRQGETLAVISSTPQTVNISKSRHDITLTCNKDGFQTAVHQLPSNLEEMTFGNLLLGGVIGIAIDAGSGAMNKYKTNVTLTLQPNYMENIIPE